jgi:hypothetical protein
MTGGMRGRGFFAGAVGGLALALLLVGAASFLPQPSHTLQTASPPQGSAASMTAINTNKASAASTTTTAGALFASNQSGAQNAGVGAPAVSTATTTTTMASSTATVAASTTSRASGASTPAAQGGFSASSGAQQQKPNSLLTVLPGEGAASLFTTLSPLVLGLLVAALVYGAYTRRQDSSS